MADAAAFDDAAFLGLSRRGKRDPYRLSLLAQHLESEERARAVLAIQGGTLVVTDRRLLEFRAHLEVHGAWNVKEFRGYAVRREFPRSSVRGVEHVVGAPDPITAAVEDAITLLVADASHTLVVSRGPEPTLDADDFESLRAAVFGQPK